MNIIKSLSLQLMLIGASMAPLTAIANTSSYCCFENIALDYEANMSIDNMEESIRAGINESVKIVKPVYDSRVRSYLRTYIEIHPRFTEEMIGRAEIYFPLFEKYLEAYGMPIDLKYMAIVESALRPLATSPVGAAGMWQFMPPTGRQFGLHVTQYVDERRDPEKSTEAAVQYLKQLYERFGTWELAMAAYNAGPGRVNSAIRRSGTHDYWELQNYLPRETRSYVPGFIAANYLFAHYTDHNLIPKRPHSDFLNTAVIKIYEGMSFSDINAVTGVSMSTLRFLNPMYSRRYIPQSVVGYALQLPALAASIFIEHLGIDPDEMDKYTETFLPIITGAELEFEMQVVVREYRVKSGDNLYNIAQANACSINDLMTWNKLTSSDLRISQRLKIHVAERVAVYPDITSRKVAVLNLIPTVMQIGHTFPKVTFHDSSQFVNARYSLEIPQDPIVLRKRMCVKDAIRLSTNDTKLSTNATKESHYQVSYKLALPGYIIALDK